jgi:hypothetical protein
VLPVGVGDGDAGGAVFPPHAATAAMHATTDRSVRVMCRSRSEHRGARLGRVVIVPAPCVAPPLHSGAGHGVDWIGMFFLGFPVRREVAACPIPSG